MKKRWIQVGAAAVIMAVSIPFSAFAGKWQQNDRGWWWQNDDATWPASSWMWLDGNKDGIAECYYFDPDGYMLVNTETPDHYQVNDSGAWVVDGVVQIRNVGQNQNQAAAQAENKSGQQAPANGWNQEEYDVWRYYVNSRMVTDDWRNVDGKRYYFDSDGIMLTGFQEIDGATYYFDSQGALSKKSFNLDGMHYEVDSTGEIIDEMDLEDWKYQKKYKTDSGSQQNSGTSGTTGSAGTTGNQSSGNGDSQVDMSDYANRVFEIVNEEREAAGKSALEWDDTLGECAAVRAEELTEKYSHTRPDGTLCFSILDEYGIRGEANAENIAKGQSTPKQVMNAWMNSEGHKKNILNDNYEKIGVGFYYDGSYHWVQMFSK